MPCDSAMQPAFAVPTALRTSASTSAAAASAPSASRAAVLVVASAGGRATRRAVLAGAAALGVVALCGVRVEKAAAAMYDADLRPQGGKYEAGNAKGATLRQIMPQITDGLAALEDLQVHWEEKTAAGDGDGLLS
jgi:hypothetical protein